MEATVKATGCHRFIPSAQICQVDLCSSSRVFDRNGDGYISKAEFKHCMMHFGEQFTDDEVEEMIADADSNNDGKIDYAEFSQMILKEIKLEEGNTQKANEDVKARARANASNYSS